jgi:hypothetical protein
MIEMTATTAPWRLHRLQALPLPAFASAFRVLAGLPPSFRFSVDRTVSDTALVLDEPAVEIVIQHL